MANYFTLLGLPELPVTDRKQLQQAYIMELKKVHPDYQQAQGELEKSTADSSVINAAFHTLKNAMTALSHFLKVKGVLEDEEKFQLPPDVLMEMMELNEMAAEDEDRYAIERRKLAEALTEEFNTLAGDGDTAWQDTNKLQALKLWYYKRKYFDRLPPV